MEGVCHRESGITMFQRVDYACFHESDTGIVEHFFHMVVAPPSGMADASPVVQYGGVAYPTAGDVGEAGVAFAFKDEFARYHISAGPGRVTVVGDVTVLVCDRADM